ncbi:hypothetical protein Tco_1534258 [Tanacetum coccineum]
MLRSLYHHHNKHNHHKFTTIAITTTTTTKATITTTYTKSTGKRRGKRPVKKFSVDVSVDDEEDPKGLQQQTCWTVAEEICLAECWVAVSKSNEIGFDRGLDSFWKQVLEDFNAKSLVKRTKDMITRNEESNTGNKKFTQEHVWRVLKTRPKWDTSKPVNSDDPTRHPELFGGDPRERPPGKPQNTKKNQIGHHADLVGSHSQDLSDVLQSEFRRKREAAKKGYEVKMQKNLTLM